MQLYVIVQYNNQLMPFCKQLKEQQETIKDKKKSRQHTCAGEDMHRISC